MIEKKYIAIVGLAAAVLITSVCVRNAPASSANAEPETSNAEPSDAPAEEDS